MGKGADKMARAVELAKMIDAPDEPVTNVRDSAGDGWRQRGAHSSEFHHYVAFDNLILLAEVGSNVTGVPRKQDTDQTGVCIEPREVILAINAMGTAAFEQYEYHSADNDTTNTAGDLDVTIFGLRKFARMAAAGAPTGLVPLFVPQNAYEVSTTAGAALRASRELFVTKQAGLRFAGLARRHQHRLQLGQGRKELISKHSYDTDYAYHGLRALLMGRDLMANGDIMIPMTDYILNYLRQVREGKYTKKQILKDFTNHGMGLAKAIEMTSLPEGPDYDKINALLARMYEEHWAAKEAADGAH
jgi:predicted nucleotidyltransferase